MPISACWGICRILLFLKNVLMKLAFVLSPLTFLIWGNSIYTIIYSQEFNSHTSILTKRCVGINMVWATAHSTVMLPGQQILQKCYEPNAYNAHLLKNTMHPFNLYLHRKLWGERRDLRIWYECCWWGKNTEQSIQEWNSTHFLCFL